MTLPVVRWSPFSNNIKNQSEGETQQNKNIDTHPPKKI